MRGGSYVSVWKKLGEVDNRIIYALLVLSLLLPLIKPIGLPISISAHTKRSFSVIDKVKPGDRVIFDVTYSVSGAADVQPQAVAVLKHLFEKGARVIFVTTLTDGPMIIESLIKPWEQAGKKYGVDFCNLGYLAGGENAINMYNKDLKKAYPKDYRGNPTDKLPILEGVNGAKDVQLYVFFSTQNSDMYVRQVSPYKIPIVGGLINTIAPQAEPYVNAGQLSGILVGLRGGAEYELLLKSPGAGVASMDAQSMGHLLIIAFIILANLAYFFTRSEQPAKKGAAK